MNNGARPVQVIIAGAGPTGLMLAAELGLAGASTVVVLERQPQIRKQSRALGMHAGTLEVFDQRGIADRFTGRLLTRGHFAEIPLDCLKKCLKSSVAY